MSCRATVTSPTRQPAKLFEERWGVTLDPNPGCRIPNMFDAAISGQFKGLYVQGEDMAQSDPDIPSTSPMLLRRWNALSSKICFSPRQRSSPTSFYPALPSWKRMAHSPTRNAVSLQFAKSCSRLPERKIGKSLRIWRMPWVIPCSTNIRGKIMEEIAALTPTFHGVSYELLDVLGSIQWPCNGDAVTGTPIMHVGRVCSRQGIVRADSFCPNGRANEPQVSAAADYWTYPVPI